MEKNNKKNYNMTSCYKEAWFPLLVDKDRVYEYRGVRTVQFRLWPSNFAGKLLGIINAEVI